MLDAYVPSRLIRPLFIVILAGLASIANAMDWHDSVSPHFAIHQEQTFGAAGLVLNVEKIHNRLRMDLAMFSPWMDKERVNLYLYANAASYQNGEFQPPTWSDGLAFYDRKIIVVYNQASPIKLNQVIAHEMTHLFFESYWGEVQKAPPHWLNEGLAMMEETDQGSSVKESEWFRAMVYLGPSQMPAFSQVLQVVPSTDLKDKQAAGLWYVEAYSLVYFLYREHTRLQFMNFNENLRNGKSLQEALWLAYRYGSVDKFEATWRDWVRHESIRYAGRITAQTGESSEPTTGGTSLPPLKPMRMDFRSTSFHSLRDDGN